MIVPVKRRQKYRFKKPRAEQSGKHRNGRHRSIYYVLDHIGGIKYVGCALDAKARLARHISQARNDMDFYKKASPFYTWLIGEVSANRSVRLIVIRDALRDWHEDEWDEIEKVRAGGALLLNAKDRKRFRF